MKEWHECASLLLLLLPPPATDICIRPVAG
jgi:hypothetical protein